MPPLTALSRSRSPPLLMTEEERGQLEQWLRSSAPSRLAMRAMILLDCRSGRSNREIAARLQLTPRTVGKWRRRFALQRVPGLRDRLRSGAPRSISDAVVEAVLAKTLHERPANAARWSSRQLAATFGLSQRAVLRIWRSFGL